MNKNKMIVTIILVLLILMQSCSKKAGSKSSGNRAESEFSFSVGVSTMQDTSISRRIILDGSIQSVATAAITPDTGGILRSIIVSEGDRVQQGTIIAYVDPSKPGQTFLRSPVKASIAGVVSSLPTKIGNQVEPTSVIAQISDDSDLELQLAIPEVYAPDVHVGIKGFLSVLAFPKEKFSMTVRSVGEVLSTTTHTMNATLSFDTRATKIKSGMYGTISLILGTKQNVMSLRRDYIVLRYIDGKTVYGVFIVNEDNNMVRFSPVTLGIEDGDRHEITSGVSAGDVIVIAGQSALSDGNKVTVYKKDGEIVQSGAGATTGTTTGAGK